MLTSCNGYVTPSHSSRGEKEEQNISKKFKNDFLNMLTISAVHNVHVWYACEYCIRNYLVCRNLMAAAKILRSSLASYTISNSHCMMHKQLSKIIMRWYNAPGEPPRPLIGQTNSVELSDWLVLASFPHCKVIAISRNQRKLQQKKLFIFSTIMEF